MPFLKLSSRKHMDQMKSGILRTHALCVPGAIFAVGYCDRPRPSRQVWTIDLVGGCWYPPSNGYKLSTYRPSNQ